MKLTGLVKNSFGSLSFLLWTEAHICLDSNQINWLVFIESHMYNAVGRPPLACLIRPWSFVFSWSLSAQQSVVLPLSRHSFSCIRTLFRYFIAFMLLDTSSVMQLWFFSGLSTSEGSPRRANRSVLYYPEFLNLLAMLGPQIFLSAARLAQPSLSPLYPDPDLMGWHLCRLGDINQCCHVWCFLRAC